MNGFSTIILKLLHMKNAHRALTQTGEIGQMSVVPRCKVTIFWRALCRGSGRLWALRSDGVDLMESWNWPIGLGPAPFSHTLLNMRKHAQFWMIPSTPFYTFLLYHVVRIPALSNSNTHWLWSNTYFVTWLHVKESNVNYKVESGKKHKFRLRLRVESQNSIQWNSKMWWYFIYHLSASLL